MKNKIFLIIMLLFSFNIMYSQPALSDKDTCMTKKHISKIATKIVDLEKRDSLQKLQVKNLKGQINDQIAYIDHQSAIIGLKDEQIEIQADLLTRFSNLPGQPYWWNKNTGFFIGGFIVGGAATATALYFYSKR